MRRIAFIFLILACAGLPAAAQNGFTTVTGTITDPNGVKYSCGTIIAQLITAGGAGATLNGQPFTTTTSPVQLGCPTTPGTGAAGSFAMRLADSGVILPSNTTWKFTVNINGGAPPLGTGPQSFSFTTAINCSTNTPSTCTSNQLDISTQLSALAPALGSFSAGCGPGCVVTINGTTIQTFAQALAALPAAGGTIDARVMPAGSNFNIGTFDPGTKATTVMLGPWNYNVTQIRLETGLRIIGAGDDVTVLNFTSTTAGDSVFLQPNTVDVQNALLSDFYVGFNGTTANQNCISIQTSATNLKSSFTNTFQNIRCDQYTGSGIILDASAGAQFGEGAIYSTLVDGVRLTPCNGAFGIQLKGASPFGVVIRNSQIEETCTGSAAETAFNIVSASANAFPENVSIENVSVGFMGQVAEIDGGQNVKLDHLFLFGGAPNMKGVNLAVGTGTVHSTGTVMNAWLGANNGGSGLGQGAGGFIANTSDALSTLVASNNTFQLTPTAFFTGFTNNLLAFGNTGGGISFGQSSPLYNSASNCASGTSPAVCGSAASGDSAVPTGATPTLQINTTAVTANSQISLTVTESTTVGTRLGVTCNTTLSTLVNPVEISRVAGTSFTIQMNSTLAVNPACVHWTITN